MASKRSAGVCPNSKKTTTGRRDKTNRNGDKRRPEGHFFGSRPETWCILVIRSLIAFINLHIFESTSMKTYESRFAIGVFRLDINSVSLYFFDLAIKVAA